MQLQQWLKDNDIWILSNAVQGRDRVGALYAAQGIGSRRRLVWSGDAADLLDSPGTPQRQASSIPVGALTTKTGLSASAELSAFGLSFKGDHSRDLSLSWEISEVTSEVVPGFTPLTVGVRADDLAASQPDVYKRLKGLYIAHTVWFARTLRVTVQDSAGANVSGSAVAVTAPEGLVCTRSADGSFELADNDVVPFGVSAVKIRA